MLRLRTKQTRGYPLTLAEWVAFFWRWIFGTSFLLVLAYVGILLVNHRSPVMQGVGWVGLACVLAFIGLLTAGLRRYIWLKNTGSRTDGTITSVDFSLINTFLPFCIGYWVGYEYEVNGKSYEGSSVFRRWPFTSTVLVGDAVSVVFDQRNPNVRHVTILRRML